MLADTITPDGIYVNGKGERTNYIPGWKQNGDTWRYLKKNGSYAASTWIQDSDGKWYYFHAVSDGEMGKMYAGERTPDGYVVGTDGEWSH